MHLFKPISYIYRWEKSAIIQYEHATGGKSLVSRVRIRTCRFLKIINIVRETERTNSVPYIWFLVVVVGQSNFGINDTLLCHIYIEYGPLFLFFFYHWPRKEFDSTRLARDPGCVYSYWAYLSLALLACRLSFSLCAFMSGSSSSSSALEQQLRNNNTRLITWCNLS